MEKLIKYFRSILVVLLCAMTAMDVIVIVAQVIFRFFLHVSLAWASGIGWCFIGMDYVPRRNSCDHGRE